MLFVVFTVNLWWLSVSSELSPCPTAVAIYEKVDHKWSIVIEWCFSFFSEDIRHQNYVCTLSTLSPFMSIAPSPSLSSPSSTQPFSSPSRPSSTTLSNFHPQFPTHLLPLSPTVQCGGSAGEPVLPAPPERGQSAGGAGGADRGFHRLSLHQPWAAAGHPGPVPAGAPGRPAAGAGLDGGSMLTQAGVLMHDLKHVDHMLA